MAGIAARAQVDAGMTEVGRNELMDVVGGWQDYFRRDFSALEHCNFAGYEPDGVCIMLNGNKHIANLVLTPDSCR
jgi:hypothetical protein